MPNHPPEEGKNENGFSEEEIQQVDYERYIHKDYFSDEETPNQVDYEKFIHEDYFSDKDRLNHSPMEGRHKDNLPEEEMHTARKL